jgi:xeroderma pigmentosum group C-complementing protein
MPSVAAACRSLGVDYAPALVGFDVQGGRNLPKILGVVVCQVRRLNAAVACMMCCTWQCACASRGNVLLVKRWHFIACRSHAAQGVG